MEKILKIANCFKRDILSRRRKMSVINPHTYPEKMDSKFHQSWLVYEETTKYRIFPIQLQPDFPFLKCTCGYKRTFH